MNKEIITAIIWIVIYLIVGHKILWEAIRNIARGQVFDENFLMCVATVGALLMQEYDEAVGVMVLYNIGEYFQDRAVDKSRKSISDLMDIRPDYANIERDGELVKVDPFDVMIGDVIVVKPGERIALDGVVVEGSSKIDTAALTGESLPRNARIGDEVLSGSINLNGLIRVKVTRDCSESTAMRILELVEDAADSKAKAENFITKFARYYTPVVCACALTVAVIPPIILGGGFSEWVRRGLIFLVVSCPCALVISVPLSFFGGIGGASSKGILIKGGNYLEALSKAEIVAFDKTGTLTKGVFNVIAIHPHNACRESCCGIDNCDHHHALEYGEEMDENRLLELAAIAESYSDHPISRSLADEYNERGLGKVDKKRVEDYEEFGGEGVSAYVDGHKVCAGNERLMARFGIAHHECSVAGTIVHIAVDGIYCGHIVISDVIKDDAAEAVSALKKAGITSVVMLSGDKKEIAEGVSEKLGLDECYSEVLPSDKLSIVEKLIQKKSAKKTVAFVGDGINDAPALTRADIGIAMGGMGSAAAVEAADIVLMNDKPSDVAKAVRFARRTMRIIYQNIVFSIGIKILVLILAAFGFTNMWLAIFADVGVCMLAILNSMRTLNPNI